MAKKSLTAPGWQRMDYTQYGIHQKLKDLSLVERHKVAAAEYTRLRDIAQKRIKRLGESKFSGSAEYKQNKQGFPKISEMKSQAELEKALERVFNFNMAAKSTITGQQKAIDRTLETFAERGMGDYIKSEKDLKEFGQFMDAARAKYGSSQYDSSAFRELYVSLKDKNISPVQVRKHFDFWRNNQEKLKELPRYGNNRPVSAERVYKELSSDAHSSAIPFRQAKRS